MPTIHLRVQVLQRWGGQFTVEVVTLSAGTSIARGILTRAHKDQVWCTVHV